MSTTIQDLLETGKIELRRLLGNTSSNETSSKKRKEFITPQIVLEMLRQEQAQVAAAAA
jgi:hypothetical protein